MFMSASSLSVDVLETLWGCFCPRLVRAVGAGRLPGYEQALNVRPDP